MAMGKKENHSWAWRRGISNEQLSYCKDTIMYFYIILFHLKLSKIILMIITINRRSMNSLLQFKKLNHKGFNKQDLSLLNKLSVFLFNKHNQYKFNKLKLFKFRKLENNYRVLHKYQTSFVNQFNIFKNEHLEHKFT